VSDIKNSRTISRIL